MGSHPAPAGTDRGAGPRAILTAAVALSILLSSDSARGGDVRITAADRPGCSSSLVNALGEPLLSPSGTTSRLGVVVDGRFHALSHGSVRGEGAVRCTGSAGGIETSADLVVEGGLLRLRLEARNTGLAAREVGLVAVLDTQLGKNDGSPPYVDREGKLYTTEKEYVGAVPETWPSFDRFPDPNVRSVASYVHRPNRLAFPYWRAALDNPYGYVVREGERFDADSAVRAIWSARLLAPGQARVAELTCGEADDLQQPRRVGLRRSLERVAEALEQLTRSRLDSTAQLLDTLVLTGSDARRKRGLDVPSAVSKSIEATQIAPRAWGGGLRAHIGDIGSAGLFFAAEVLLDRERRQRMDERYAALLELVSSSGWVPGLPGDERVARLRAALDAELRVTERGAALSAAMRELAAREPAIVLAPGHAELDRGAGGFSWVAREATCAVSAGELSVRLRGAPEGTAVEPERLALPACGAAEVRARFPAGAGDASAVLELLDGSGAVVASAELSLAGGRPAEPSEPGAGSGRTGAIVAAVIVLAGVAAALGFLLLGPLRRREDASGAGAAQVAAFAARRCWVRVDSRTAGRGRWSWRRAQTWWGGRRGARWSWATRACRVSISRSSGSRWVCPW